ncbi:MAG: GGDEF domain-containing protein [Planctomycetes bacterium]|nr:GGDEF domain-containing protein [Planctomycetota bacterium]
MNHVSRKTSPIRRSKGLDPTLLERNPYLVQLEGPDAGRRSRLFPGEAQLGRSWDCEVVLQDHGVSRVHALVRVDADGATTVVDQGSTNGTRVNGQLLGAERRDLHEGDRLQLGDAVLLRFSLQTVLTAEWHESLYSAAVRDRLTEVYNRAYLNDRLERDFADAAREDVPLSLLLFDLDHFKRVNDTWGHLAGDQVLKTIAERVQASVREGDVVARYGGEEFVVLLREAALQPALRVAERLRRAICAQPVEFEGHELSVSASFGVATTVGNRLSSASDLLASADANLYRAKESGRNRVCSAASSSCGAKGTPAPATLARWPDLFGLWKVPADLLRLPGLSCLVGDRDLDQGAREGSQLLRFEVRADGLGGLLGRSSRQLHQGLECL